MKVFIRDTNPKFILASQAVGFENVEYVDITKAKAACVVLPANSFGIMGSGAALALKNRFPGVEDDLRETIKHQGGELLIGQAIICQTDDEEIPFMIAAPTMRIPKVIADPIDIYLATRAAMREWLFVISNIEELEKEIIAFPGMGTGKGGVDFPVAARAMKIGIEDAINGINIPNTKEDMFKQSYDLHRKINFGL